MTEKPQPVTASDEQLITAALNGDIKSFGPIVERYWKMATALTLSKINNAAAM